jgi:uncharacterized protein (DUF305 family)
MQSISLKTALVALTFTAASTLGGGILAGCSKATSESTQAPNTTAATPMSNQQDVVQNSGMGGMGGMGGMNHNMSMNLGPADANYDLRFIDAMIQHHQGAVNMAKDVLNKSQRAETKKLAGDIIKAQEKEINQMKQWRTAWYPKASSTPMAYDSKMGHHAMTPEQMNNMMMSINLGAADAQFDLRFINAMILHHEGALVMAKDALSKSKRPEIKKLSQDILTSQQKEIEQMKQWRQTWYKK